MLFMCDIWIAIKLIADVCQIQSIFFGHIWNHAEYKLWVFGLLDYDHDSIEMKTFWSINKKGDIHALMSHMTSFEPYKFPKDMRVHYENNLVLFTFSYKCRYPYIMCVDVQFYMNVIYRKL